MFPRNTPILHECSVDYDFIQSVLDCFVPPLVHKYTEEWKVCPPLSVPPKRKQGTCAFPVWCGGWEVLGNAEPFFSFASSCSSLSSSSILQTILHLTHSTTPLHPIHPSLSPGLILENQQYFMGLTIFMLLLLSVWPKMDQIKAKARVWIFYNLLPYFSSSDITLIYQYYLNQNLLFTLKCTDVITIIIRMVQQKSRCWFRVHGKWHTNTNHW